MHKVRQKIHPEKEGDSDRKKCKYKRHRCLFMLSLFFKDNIVFSNREFFLQDTINLVPSEDDPRTENEQKETHDKTEDSWIEEDSNTQYQTKSSEENHRYPLYQFSPRYKKNPPFLRDNLSYMRFMKDLR